MPAVPPPAEWPYPTPDQRALTGLADFSSNGTRIVTIDRDKVHGLFPVPTSYFYGQTAEGQDIWVDGYGVVARAGVDEIAVAHFSSVEERRQWLRDNGPLWFPAAPAA